MDYIKKFNGQQSTKGKYLLWGGGALVGLALLYYTFSGKKQEQRQQQEQRQEQQIVIEKVEGLDNNIKYVISELKKNPESMAKYYSVLAKFVVEGADNNPQLKTKLVQYGLGFASKDAKYQSVLIQSSLESIMKNPEYANKFIKAGLDSIYKNDKSIDPKTYVAMFKSIKEKAEQNPKIMELFGPAAKHYMEKKFAQQYVGQIEQNLENTFDEIKKEAPEIFKKLKKGVQELLKEFMEGNKMGMIKGGLKLARKTLFYTSLLFAVPGAYQFGKYQGQLKASSKPLLNIEYKKEDVYKITDPLTKREYNLNFKNGNLTPLYKLKDEEKKKILKIISGEKNGPNKKKNITKEKRRIRKKKNCFSSYT